MCVCVFVCVCLFVRVIIKPIPKTVPAKGMSLAQLTAMAKIAVDPVRHSLVDSCNTRAPNLNENLIKISSTRVVVCCVCCCFVHRMHNFNGNINAAITFPFQKQKVVNFVDGFLAEISYFKYQKYAVEQNLYTNLIYVQ